MDNTCAPTWQFGFGVFIGAMVIVLIVTPLEYWDGKNWRDQAVRHGCAEYYLDKNYDKQWRWK